MAIDKSDLPILPIPQVPKHWFSGNLPDVDPAFYAKSYWRLADLYGPIYELDLGGASTVVISSYEFSKEIQDDDKFEKKVSTGSEELRVAIKDALFTAHSDEKIWGIAHRILMPVFGPLGVRKMFDQQMDIASQMILRWDRMGPNNEILCSDDFTRLAFDTIGLCAFNYRFNEFYRDSPHEFAQQMGDMLVEASKRANRTRIETALHWQDTKKYWENIKAQHKLCDEIIAERVNNPDPKINDLLNVMLHTADPVTGEKLSHENIRYQMNTFLIAGHETTSGTLAFLFYCMLTNPETYHKAQKEVDEVVGTDALTLDHLSKLKYCDAAIKETLRCCSPIATNTRHAKETTLIGTETARYEVRPDQWIASNTKAIQRDRKVWGEDAEEFKPERMLDFQKIPEGAWRPFGIGMRACIGRAFAEQEMIINVALILQRFQVEMVDPGYKLEYKATLTIKPKDFKLKVRRRPGRSINVGLNGKGQVEEDQHKATEEHEGEQPMLVLYGSNAGTCQAYAEELASRASECGFHCDIKPMDAAVEHLPTDRPIAIITPSYEGKPADNARKFVSWLDANKDSKCLTGRKYFVFGVGNKEWAQTFHKVPKLVDYLMETMGAERIIPTGFVDVETDTTGPFEEWCDDVLKTLGQGTRTSTTKGLSATISKSQSAQTLAGFDNTTGIVTRNLLIADKSVGPSKMHMEVQLPEDMSYRTGDYLAILPSNHRTVVRRVLARFELHADDAVAIANTRKEFLKSAAPMSVYDLLSTRVELATPITQRQLKTLAETAADAKQKEDILKMSDSQWSETLKKRFSILDVLEDHPSCKISFGDYLDMLKPMTVRQYSISSCAFEDKADIHQFKATITYDVHEDKAWSGGERTFNGVASTYLADLKPGDSVRCSVRPTNSGFHLPKDIHTPIIMIASGTGLAPMRGFIEERAAVQKARGIPLAPALLYFGCRDIDHDYIYKAQLEEWEKQGVVSLRPCFSKHGTDDDHWKYTSERIYDEREECKKLFRNGAKVFICGSASKLARSTADLFVKLRMESFPDESEEDAVKWLDEIKEHRYVSDVFG